MGVTRGTARSWSAPRPFWQIQPGVVSFNAAISACAVGSEWERALQLLRALPQTLGLRSDSELGRASWEGSQCKNHQATKFVLWVTCFVSPDTCFQRRLPIWLWFVAGLSLRLRLAGNVVTATAAISACATALAWRAALVILRKLSSGMRPSVTLGYEVSRPMAHDLVQ